MRKARPGNTIREILKICVIRDTYKQALRGLFVTGTSDARTASRFMGDKRKGRMMNQD